MSCDYKKVGNTVTEPNIVAGEDKVYSMYWELNLSFFL